MRFLKEYIIIIVIIFLISTIEVWTSYELRNSIDNMKNGIQSVQNKVDEKNEKEAQQEFDKLKENWKDQADRLAFFTEHNELEKINNDLVKIEANFESDENDMLMENIAELKFILDHIEEKNQLRWKNIF